MALAYLAMYPQKIQAWPLQITNGIGTTVTTLVTAGTNGSIIESMNCSLTDTTANGLQVFLTISGTAYLLGSVTIPISSGNVAGTPAIDILRSGQLPGIPVDANGDYAIYLPSGATLQVAATAAPAAGKLLEIVAMGADY